MSQRETSLLTHILDGESKNPVTVTIKKFCDGFDITMGQFFSTPEFDALERKSNRFFTTPPIEFHIPTGYNVLVKGSYGMAKPLENLTIVDDFMFGAVMSNPKWCKPLLELVLGVQIRRIEYPELQKAIDQRYGSKSIRLDVYVEDDDGTVYDVEIQTTSKKNLPKRTRYYQGIIDINILEKGEDYRALKRSFVIFICTYDPFGKSRYVYTFENRCREDLSISLGDEATKMILNTKGAAGEVSDDLKDLLHYMDGMEPKSDYTKELQNAVDEVKADERWRREYMVLIERDREKVRLGRYSQTVAAVRRGRGKFSSEAIADLMMVDLDTVDSISAAIDAHPEWDDEEVAENLDVD